MDFDSLSTLSEFVATGIAALVCAIGSGLCERRERRRRDLDRISTMPWGLISVLSTILAIITLATAAKLYLAGN